MRSLTLSAVLSWGRSRLILMVAVLLVHNFVGGNKFGFMDQSGRNDIDLREIQRQNQITKQILQNFLEKSLYGKRFSNTPSLLDILPNGIVRMRSSNNNIQELLNNSTQESDSRETLDGDETENVDSYYEDFNFEGKCTRCSKKIGRTQGGYRGHCGEQFSRQQLLVKSEPCREKKQHSYFLITAGIQANNNTRDSHDVCSLSLKTRIP